MDTRITLRPVFVVMALGCITVFLTGPLAVAVTVLFFAPPDVSVPVALAAVLFVGIIGYAMSSSNQWAELDDGTIRARRLLTRKIVVQRVEDIVSVVPLHSKAMGPLENAVADAMMGTSNRGFELRFRDGSKIGLVRGDMAGLDQFMTVLAARIAERGVVLGK